MSSTTGIPKGYWCARQTRGMLTHAGSDASGSGRVSVKKIYQGLPSPAVAVQPSKRRVVRPPRTAPVPTEVHYPSEDGRPMADNSRQARVRMNSLYSALRIRYERDAETFVGIEPVGVLHAGRAG